VKDETGKYSTAAGNPSIKINNNFINSPKLTANLFPVNCRKSNSSTKNPANKQTIQCMTKTVHKSFACNSKLSKKYN
jgi:hypothetical protein